MQDIYNLASYWTCNDCIAHEKLSTASVNHDDSYSMHHEHIGAANI